MNLTQRQLKIFAVTAALGSITRASEALHMSQPALTRALQDFESQLGIPLFSRSTRRLQLSREGEKFLPTAQRLLKDMEQAFLHIQSDGEQVAGQVSIAVGTAFGGTILPKVLAQVLDAHPDIQIRLIDDNSAGITQRVAQAQVDLGIGSPVGDISGLNCQALLQAPVGLLGRPDLLRANMKMDSSSLRQLRLLKEPMSTSIAHLLHAQGSDLAALMDSGHEVSSLALQLAMTKAGLGVAVVSALGASHPDAQGLRFVPWRPAIHRQIFLMTHRRLVPSNAVRAVITALMQAQGLRIQGLHPLVKWSLPSAV
jgi:LysR family transcriptional regulator, carnitine catabolism transcriptional activator